MSRRFIVTRHPGARDWLAKKKVSFSLLMEHLDLSVLEPGDEVLGTIPLQMAHRVFQKGALYYHLVLEMPFSKRGMELTAEELENYGARFEPFEVSARPLLVPYQQWLERQVSQFEVPATPEFIRTAQKPPIAKSNKIAGQDEPNRQNKVAIDAKVAPSPEAEIEQAANTRLSDPEGIPVVVCIASDKNLPNWLVYKELANRFAPQLVHCWILCSQSRQVVEYSEALRTEVIQDQSGAVPSDLVGERVRLFSNLPESYTEARTYLQNCLLPATEQFAKLNGQNARLLVNLTGGKKSMSLALNDVGRQLGAEMLYFHGNAGFEWLDPTGQRTGMQTIEAVAQPITLLGLYGYKLEKIQTGTWHKKVASELAKRLLKSSSEELGWLNSILHADKHLQMLDKAKRHDDMLGTILKLTDTPIKNFVKVLNEVGATMTDDTGATVLAKKGTGRFLFRSGWFEEYFQDALQKVILDFRNEAAFSEVWAGNMRIEGDTQAAREIDALFLQGSDLWIVECKAKSGNKSDKLRQAMDQSASLTLQLGGQNTKCLIVYAGDYSTSKVTQAELRKTNTILIQGPHSRPDRIKKSIAICLGLRAPDKFWLEGQAPVTASSKNFQAKPAAKPK